MDRFADDSVLTQAREAASKLAQRGMSEIVVKYNLMSRFTLPEADAARIASEEWTRTNTQRQPAFLGDALSEGIPIGISWSETIQNIINHLPGNRSEGIGRRVGES
jgi:hypothetical protein